MAKQNTYNPIYRTEQDRILGGVSGGLGEYFRTDPNIVRLIFILLTVFGGSGIIIYLVLWIILPPKSQTGSDKNYFKENISEMKDKVNQFAHDLGNETKKRKNEIPSRELFAYLAIVAGIIFLFENFGFGNFINFSRLWPLLLIAIGISLILRRK